MARSPQAPETYGSHDNIGDLNEYLLRFCGFLIITKVGYTPESYSKY